MNSRDGHLLSLDIGTGTVRGVLFDLQGQLVHQETRARYYFSDPSGVPFLENFAPAVLWTNICELIHALLHHRGVSAESILAISATAQRFSYLFLDDQDEALYAGPNLDARGAYSQGDIDERLGNDYYLTTGQWPPLTSALARLLWFQREAVDIFSRISTIMMLNDWALYKLCGEKHSEVTAASASGFLDVNTRQWSQKIPDVFGINSDLFPPLFPSGEVIGQVHGQASQETGLKAGTPIVVGGGDTQCALLGAGMWGPDQVGIVAGTTAPLCLAIPSPVVDPGKRAWTSCHVEPQSWILESNSQWAGSVIQWLADLLTSAAGPSCVKSNIFEWMEQKASEVPPGSQDTRAFLGPSIMNQESFISVPPGVIYFPPPAHPMTESPVQAGHFIRAAMENIAFALRGNFEQISSIKSFQPDQIYVTGGLARSQLFCQILSDCLGLPVIVERFKEGSALGAAVCAASGIGAFSDMATVQKELVQQDKVFQASLQNRSIYQTAYDSWRNIYKKTTDL